MFQPRDKQREEGCPVTAGIDSNAPVTLKLISDLKKMSYIIMTVKQHDPGQERV